ncbi:alpha/beta hydrolase [Nonomuraea sp. NPDC000554]|uniref:alpha/beta fold hydrolase n=1 Tax=Nonomuraea sp. NPDC000554 TaxID=3154259 RepID=UPI003325CB51
MTIWHEEAGAGEPLVLLHSGVVDSRLWDPQWQALAERFRVIRVDYRGFGRTPFQADEPYSDCGDVAAVLAELGVAKATFVASSYGCRVALQLAQSGFAERLVLLNPDSDLPPTPDLEAFTTEEERLIELGDLQAASELNARTWLGPHATPDAHERVVEMQRHAFTVQLAADPEPSQFSPDIDLTSIQAPALVVVGAHDLLWARQSARHLAEHLPHAELVELDWAGHLPNLERPEEIQALLLDYL